MRITLALCLLFGVPLHSQNTVTFTLGTSVVFSTGVLDIATADLFGSPKPETIVLDRFLGRRIRIYSNLDATPTFMDILVAPTSNSLVIGDVDGDGDRDIVTTPQLMGSISVLLNQNGVFSRTDYVALQTMFPTVYSAPRLADIDGDGDLDLLRGHQIYLGDGSGAFAGPTLIPPTMGSIGTQVEWGDFDGDGDLDAVEPYSVTGIPQPIVTHLNDGTGTFSSTISTPVPSWVRTLALGNVFRVADVDGDGRDDFVVATVHSSEPGFGIPMLFAFKGLSDGSFLALPPAPAPFCPQEANLTLMMELVVAELNGDAHLDLILGASTFLDGQSSQQIYFYPGLGGGSFGDAVLVAQSPLVPISEPPRLEAADIDDDGDVDLVTYDQPTGVIESRSAVITPGVAAPSITITRVGAQSLTVPSMGRSTVGPSVLVADASGLPVVDVPVTFYVDSGPNIFGFSPCNTYRTGADGTVTAHFYPYGSSGTSTIRARLTSGPTVSFTITVASFYIAASSPQTQTIFVNGDPPQVNSPVSPLQVSVFDPSTFVPLTNVPVLFELVYAPTPQAAFTQPGGMFAARSIAVSDAQGHATLSFNPLDAQSAGSTSIRASVSTISYADFSVTIDAVSHLVPVAGAGQGTDFGEAFHRPFVFRALDTSGVPIAGVPVTVFAAMTAGVGATSQQTVMTDCGGNATVMIGPMSTKGYIRVTASRPAIGEVATVLSFIRHLDITPLPTSGIAVTYFHEQGPQPIILAFDVPQPTGITTPYGVIHTSILQGSVALASFDPFGLSGQPFSPLIANPTFFHVFAVPPNLQGSTIVTQVYGFDDTYYPDLAQAIFVSNPVFMNF